ncbi:MAG: hypothetical protein ACOC8Y_02600 [Candidatus Natronoplasma sp.]
MDDPKIVSCDHTQNKNGEKRTLTIKCKECDDDFNFKDCVTGLILALNDVYKIESIVISDHMEKKFDKKQVEILTQIRDIVDDIESFSSRVPNGDECSGCEIKPSSLYPKLKKEFISNPGIIYEEIPQLKDKIMERDNCVDCKEDLKEELIIIAEKALELKSDVFAEAFGIKG